MSPTERVGGAARGATPAVVTDGPNTADDHHLEEKSAAVVGAMDKVLTMLGDLSERMNRMEVSQKEQVSKHQKGSPGTSIFGSVLGVGAGMSLQALERTPPPKKSLNVSPATYFGARRHNQEDVEGRPVGQVAQDFNMGPGPGPVHHRQDMPGGYYAGAGMPNRMHVHPTPQFTGMPDAQNQKLALQPLDGKELLPWPW
ncbi:unnamed protein product [Peronospora destructor]|uniref:Peroxin-14 n=1 Tax=Peronospora destructor TaxID=86335 RepID=A0AAV0TYQ4_9STRA|nr:unnamed protein product [Peronospora destructor]